MYSNCIQQSEKWRHCAENKLDKDKRAETHMEFNESEVLQSGANQAFCWLHLYWHYKAKMCHLREQAFSFFVVQRTASI